LKGRQAPCQSERLHLARAVFCGGRLLLYVRPLRRPTLLGACCADEGVALLHGDPPWHVALAPANAARNGFQRRFPRSIGLVKEPAKALVVRVLALHRLEALPVVPTAQAMPAMRTSIATKRAHQSLTRYVFPATPGLTVRRPRRPQPQACPWPGRPLPWRRPP